jgi:hypothetical protein
MVESKVSHHGGSSHGNTRGTTVKSIKSVDSSGISTGNTNNNNSKVMMINFDDSYRTQVPHLNSVSTNKLYYELGYAKQCFANHGYQVPIFGYPVNLGSGNSTVVNGVAKYYSIARTGSDPLMFLDCKGYVKHPQIDCSTFLPDGTLSYVNRYDIRSQSFDHIHSNAELSSSQLFQRFIQRVNSQLPYNKDGTINAIPIVTYHNLTYSNNVYNQ